MPCSCVFMRVCVKDSETVIDGERLFVCSKLALGLQGQMHVLTTNTWLFVISFSHWDWLRSTAGWMNRRQVRSLISFNFVCFYDRKGKSKDQVLHLACSGHFNKVNNAKIHIAKSKNRCNYPKSPRSCLKGERENIVSGNLVYSQAGEKVLHEVQYCANVLS